MTYDEIRTMLAKVIDQLPAEAGSAVGPLQQVERFLMLNPPARFDVYAVHKGEEGGIGFKFWTMDGVTHFVQSFGQHCKRLSITEVEP